MSISPVEQPRSTSSGKPAVATYRAAVVHELHGPLGVEPVAFAPRLPLFETMPQGITRRVAARIVVQP